MTALWSTIQMFRLGCGCWTQLATLALAAVLLVVFLRLTGVAFCDVLLIGPFLCEVFG